MPWQVWAENRRLTLAYRRVFESPDANLVLGDLAVFCRATSSTVDEPEVTQLSLAREEGKRLVWLRIANFLHMDRGEIDRQLRALRNEIVAETKSVVEQARMT
jgi:hypothetical protein